MSTNIDNNFLIHNLKNLLQEKLWLLEKRLQHKRQTTRYKTFTQAESRILATLRGEALTISEVARKLDISRQAVHKNVSTLVKEKILSLEPIIGNARDKRIIFTREGEKLKQTAAKFLLELEEEVKAALGASNFKVLKNLLEKEW